jgi:lipopolysaccharide transport system ATP-binding protein
MAVHVGFEALQPTEDVVFALSMHSTDGHVVFGQNTWGLGERLPALLGTGEITFRFESLSLLEGRYPLTIGIHSSEGGQMYAWREQYEHVDVVNVEENHAWGLTDLHVKLDLSRLGAGADGRQR